MKKYFVAGLVLTVLTGGVVLFLAKSPPSMPTQEGEALTIVAEFRAVLQDFSGRISDESGWSGQGTVLLPLGALVTAGLGGLLLAGYRRRHLPVEPLPSGQQFFVGGAEPLPVAKKLARQPHEKPLPNNPAAPSPPTTPTTTPTPEPTTTSEPEPQPLKDEEVHPDGPDHIIIG